MFAKVRFLPLAVLCLAAAAMPARAQKTWSVDPSTLAQVSAESMPGDVLVLAPGEYRGELALKSRQTVRGAETGGTVNGLTIAIRDASAIAIRNVRLENGAFDVRNASGLTIEDVVVGGSGETAVAVRLSRDVVLRNLEVRSARQGVLLEGLTGQCTIERSRFHGNASRQLMVVNGKDTLKVTIAATEISDSAAPSGQQGALIVANGSALMEMIVESSTFRNNRSTGLDVIAEGDSRVRVAVRASLFRGNAGAIHLSAGEGAILEYDVTGNPSVESASSAAINVFLAAGSRGSIKGTIARNMIEGIELTGNGAGVFHVTVEQNTIRGVGIRASAGEGKSAMALSIANNRLLDPRGGAPAIRVNAGTLATDASTVCASVRDNTIEGVWDASGAIHMVHRFGGTRFRIAALPVAAGSDAVAAFVGAANGGARVRAVLRPESSERGFERAEHCAP